MRKILTVMIAIGIICLAKISYAECTSCRKLGPRSDRMQVRSEPVEDRLGQIKGLLGLSEEQYQKLQAHKKGHRNKRERIRKQLRAKREELREAVSAATLDKDRIKQIHSEIKALTAQRLDNRLEGMLEVRSILTPEQFKKMNEFIKTKKDQRQMQKKGAFR